MRLKRIMAGALTAALALGATPAALAAELPQTDAKVTVQAANIEDQYLEVGLLLAAGGTETAFQSTATVVRYDADKLAPVDWSGSAVTPGSSWAEAAQLPAKGADETTGKPALVYESGNNGYLYLGAESAKTLTLSDTAVQAATVRFRWKTAPAADAVSLADDAAAGGSPAGRAALYSNGKANLAPTPALRYEADGSSVSGGGGGGDASAFHTVVFYDWDGTLLGSRIVADGGSIAAENCPKPGYDNETGEQLTFTALLDTDGDGLGDSEQIILDTRAGYTFTGWVDYTKGSSTPHTTLGAPAGQTIPDEGVGALVSLSNIKKDMTIKAAYDEDAVKLGTSELERQYQLSYSAFEATDLGLQTTFTIRRTENARRSKDGITYLQLITTPLDSDPTTFILPLGTSDCETMTFIMPQFAAYLYENEAMRATVLNSDMQSITSDVMISADKIVEP